MRTQWATRTRKPALGSEFEVEPQTRVARPVAPPLADAAEAAAEAAAPVPHKKRKLQPHEPPKRDNWQCEEDVLLCESVAELGPTKWSRIAQDLPGRSGKQCRERWHNHLDPKVDRGPWTAAEDLAVQAGVYELGHKWALIATRIPGRTDNQVKNRYNMFLNSTARNPTRRSEFAQSRKVDEPLLDDAALLLELQRRNMKSDLPRHRAKAPAAKALPHKAWQFGEELRLAAAVQTERTRLRVGEENGWSCLLDTSWARIAQEVGTRTPSACRRRWATCTQVGDLLTLDVPIVGDEPLPVEAFAFEEALTTCTQAMDELELLCLEKYDEGQEAPLVVPAALVTTMGARTIREPKGFSFRFLPLPARRPRPGRPRKAKAKGKRDNSNAATSRTTSSPSTEAATVHEYFREMKRRDDAEAWGKNVFA